MNSDEQVIIEITGSLADFEEISRENLSRWPKDDLTMICHSCLLLETGRYPEARALAEQVGSNHLIDYQEVGGTSELEATQAVLEASVSARSRVEVDLGKTEAPEHVNAMIEQFEQILQDLRVKTSRLERERGQGHRP